MAFLRPRGGGQTPFQYSKKTQATIARELRRSIDAADRIGTTEVPPDAALMVAADASLEQRDDEAIAALAQIPPFRVGRSTYRVIGERVLDAGKPRERRVIALLCRTKLSALHEHSTDCLCATCAVHPRAWYHDATRTMHVRNANGTFTLVKRNGTFGSL